MHAHNSPRVALTRQDKQITCHFFVSFPSPRSQLVHHTAMPAPLELDPFLVQLTRMYQNEREKGNIRVVMKRST